MNAFAGLPGMRQRDLLEKVVMELSGGDDNVLYLGESFGCLGTCICQNSSNDSSIVYIQLSVQVLPKTNKKLEFTQEFI